MQGQSHDSRLNIHQQSSGSFTLIALMLSVNRHYTLQFNIGTCNCLAKGHHYILIKISIPNFGVLYSATSATWPQIVFLFCFRMDSTAKYQCYYCRQNFQIYKKIIEHLVSIHPSEVLKYREVELNSESGVIG